MLNRLNPDTLVSAFVVLVFAVLYGVTQNHEVLVVLASVAGAHGGISGALPGLRGRTTTTAVVAGDVEIQASGSKEG